MYRPSVYVHRLGRLNYIGALNLQQVLFNRMKDKVINNMIENVDNSLLLVEHEPVYTIGLRTKLYDDNYVTRLKDKLNSLNIVADFVETNRGGLITFHGPGQLVAYPIIYLGDFSKPLSGKSLKRYVETLEKVIIETLETVGVYGSHTVAGKPGVWVESGTRKIAFIGIACKRHVTMHGISINCDCDLSWFDHIVSCGIPDVKISSVSSELSLRAGTANINMDSTKPREFSSNLVERVAEAFCSSFSKYFHCTVINSGNQF